jgi:hypothetical protein
MRNCYASRQAEQIDELLRERDGVRCLAADGSTDVQSLLSLGTVPF